VLSDPEARADLAESAEAAQRGDTAPRRQGRPPHGPGHPRLRHLPGREGRSGRPKPPSSATGEAEGLRVSLTAANSKLARADLTAARRAETVSLGIPAYRDVAAATLTAPADPHDH
jgi:hypothetical protein